MNKLQRIMSNETVKSLINAIINNGEIGEFAYPLRDSVIETGEVRECRDGLIECMIASVVLDGVYEDGNCEKNTPEYVKHNSKTGPTIGHLSLIADRCAATYRGGVLYSDSAWLVMSDEYKDAIRPKDESAERTAIMVYSVSQLIAKLRSETPMMPIPVE